ncbi:hypothetical protein ACTMU2_19240 [Cupriavidus basilensis]
MRDHRAGKLALSHAGRVAGRRPQAPGRLNYGTGSISYTLYSEWLNELARIKTTAAPH